MLDKIVFFGEIQKEIKNSIVIEKNNNHYLQIKKVPFEINAGIFESTTEKLNIEKKFPKTAKGLFNSLDRFRETASEKYGIEIRHINNRAGENSAYIFAIECPVEILEDQKEWVLENYNIFIEAMDWIYEQHSQGK
jgi:hypothetical protein